MVSDVEPMQPVQDLKVECDGVLFDMDGVLVDSTAVVRRLWGEWARKHGLDPEPVIARALGQRTIETMRRFAPERAEAETAAYERRELEETAGVRAFEGARRLLGSIPRWGLVTSASRELASIRLLDCGLPLPAVLISGDDVANGKPAPDGYLRGASDLKVSPSRCVVVEDSPAGVASGIAAGMTVVATTTSHSAAEVAAAHYVIRDVDVLRWSPDGLLMSA